MINIPKFEKKKLQIVSVILFLIILVILYLLFSNKIWGCVSNIDCKNGYACYNSSVWPKGGKYEQLGDLTCHKYCTTNSDCSS